MDTAPTEIYTLSLHDALPISFRESAVRPGSRITCRRTGSTPSTAGPRRSPPESSSPIPSSTYGSSPETARSEEHTSELQSRLHLVCRLLLEKKKKKKHTQIQN